MSRDADTPAPAVVLRGMTWDHPRGVGSLIASGDIVSREHDAHVDWEARSLLAFGDQAVGDFFEDFDLMVIDHPHVPDAVAVGALLPLDTLLSAEVLDALRRESVGESHNSYSYRGRQWALGSDAAAQVSAYRPDLASGPLVYWDDVLNQARAGKVLWPYKPVDAFSTFATLLAQLGSPLARSTRFLDRDAAFTALETMIELAAVVPEWCASANPIDIAEALSSGTDYTHAVALYGYSNYARAGFRESVIAYDDIPSYDGRARGATLGGAGIAVSSATKHPELAAAVAATIAGSSVQSTAYATGGGQPGNLRAWKSPALNALTHGFFANTLRSLESAWVRPRVLGWPDLQLALSHIVHGCLTERSVGSAALNELEMLPEKFLREPLSDAR